MIAAILVISFSSSASGTDVDKSGVAPLRSLPVASVTPDKCPGVRKALRWYTKRWQHWTSLRTGAGKVSQVAPARHGSLRASCPRYLLHIRKVKAFAAHREWNRFFTYHYAWSRWLPSNWRALAICETGLNWEHSNSRFTSAFGISWAVYNSDAAYMGSPPWHVRHTPRDQYNAALGHLRRFGDGWGCPGP